MRKGNTSLSSLGRLGFLIALPLVGAGNVSRADTPDAGAQTAPTETSLPKPTTETPPPKQATPTSTTTLPAPTTPAIEGTQTTPTATTQTTAAEIAVAVPPRQLAAERNKGMLEAVAYLDGSMPTGIAVSSTGRKFVSFPRWGEPVEFTVGELRGGRPVPYPSPEINRASTANPDKSFVSVQSVVIDANDRLWVLDTGSIAFQPTQLGGPKLVGIDLKTNTPFKTIVFPRTVALPTTYLNDVRIDVRRGNGGLAFITDSGQNSPCGIIVVELGTGRSWRKLDNHPTVKPAPGFVSIAEGYSLMAAQPGQPKKAWTAGVDGIALSADGKRLYYSPLSSHHLYSVSVDALANETLEDERVAATIQDHGEKGGSDGLESDAQGRVYLTNYEENAILRRNVDGTLETLVVDPRVLWPDSLALAGDGYLYFTVNQFDRQAMFHDGQDLRQKPYTVLRVRVDGTPASGIVMR